MSLKLKGILRVNDIGQAELAKELGYSQPTISQLLNHGLWPKRAGSELAQKIRDFLIRRGISVDTIATAFEQKTQTVVPESGTNQNTLQDGFMSIPKQILHPNTRKVFGLIRDPFDEVASSDEFYQNEHIRFTRAAMLDAAKRGGFLAVVGESGSGKTTLRRDLQERIDREQLPLHVIRPYVVGMEADDMTGKTLKAGHIAESIMAAIAPHEHVKRSQEARFRQVENALRESLQTGVRSVLLIEEAHALPLPTLRHLKRFIELEDGFKRLLSIILVGQPELAIKLDPRNASVREVTQRCELITLPPLGHYLEDYITHRLKLIDVDRKQVITDDGIQAIRERLEPAAPRGHEARSYLYPLAVHNLMIAAMNLAAENGAPVVSSDIVMEVSWIR